MRKKGHNCLSRSRIFTYSIIFYHDPLGIAITDINGDFLVQIANPSGVAVQLIAMTTNDGVTLKEWSGQDPNVYSDKNPPFEYIASGQNRTINRDITATDIDYDSFTVFSYQTGLVGCWHFVKIATGTDLVGGVARYPYDPSPDPFECIPHYDEATLEIYLPGWTNELPDIIRHEYGHWAMHYANGWWFPPGRISYHVKEPSNLPTAWVEGWADFFALAVEPDGILNGGWCRRYRL